MQSMLYMMKGVSRDGIVGGCASSLGSLCVLGILFEEVDLGFGCRTVG